MLTKPNQNQHKEAVKTKFTDCMQKSSFSDNGFEVAGIAVCSLLSGVFIDNFVSTNPLVELD